ncbi:MAG: peptidoglycan DD-metalloendopeptidase family protein [Nocardioides sp.]
MRIFPRAARHRLVAAAVAGTIAVGAVSPLAHADDLKHRQKHVQGQISSATHDLDESSSRMRRTSAALESAVARLADAKGELSAVRAKLDAARIYDDQMQARLEEAVQRLATAQADLDSGQEALEQQRQHLTDTITSIYEEGDPQLMAFSALLDAQTPADLTRQMEMKNVIVGRQARAYDDLHAAEVLLQVREDNVRAAKDDVADQRREAAAHLVTMKALHQQSVDAKVKVRDMVNTARSAHQAAAAARQHDQVQLARLKKREDKIREQILAAARRAHGGYRGDTGGFLERPVPGYITSPYGWRIHPIYHYWGLHDGDDFHAPCGTPLHAAGTGTVMSEYYSSVWGNRLYLNLGTVNGKNVTVIYNHLSRYRVGTGGHVSRGDVVGYAGTTGWSTACHLHFTVMVNGTAVNPTPWF